MTVSDELPFCRLCGAQLGEGHAVLMSAGMTYQCVDDAACAERRADRDRTLELHKGLGQIAAAHRRGEMSAQQAIEASEALTTEFFANRPEAGR